MGLADMWHCCFALQLFTIVRSFASPPGMCCMQAIYVVHPTTVLKAWILALRLRLPEVYGKVVYVDRLASLDRYIASEEMPEIPQHVSEADAALDRQ